MLPKLNKIKGVHPGSLLKWELDRRNLRSAELAQEIGEHKQTLSAIINKRRSVNPNLSIKLSKFFRTDPDYFMLLQASYDVKRAKIDLENIPAPTVREILFWDTNFSSIDWNKNRRAVIQRIFERGSYEEIEEIISFYGRDIVAGELLTMKESYLPSFENNVRAHNLATA